MRRYGQADEMNKEITIEVPSATRQRLIDEFNVKGTRVFPPVLDNRAVIPVYVVNKPEERKIYAYTIAENSVTGQWQVSKTIIDPATDTDKPTLYRLLSLRAKIVANAAARATMAGVQAVQFRIRYQGVEIGYGKCVVSASGGQGFEWNQGTHISTNISSTDSSNYTINSRINFVCPYPIIVVPVSHSVNKLICLFETSDGNNFPSGGAGNIDMVFDWVIEKVNLANAFDTNVAG